MRPDQVIKTGVVQPFNLNMDPLGVARSQLDRWSAIAQQTGVPGYGPPQQATTPSGLGQPLSPIVGGRAQPDIRSAGPRITYPAVRDLPTTARQASVLPTGVAAMGVAVRLGMLEGAHQAGLMHKLSYTFSHNGQGREAGVLRAILRLVPVRGNSLQLVASLLAQLAGSDLAFVDAAIAQAGQGG